ncbi:BPL-N domain-containing protein [Sphingomonas sp.]|jgi:glutamine amidotransferase-like uncharacterized protein|uniref:BPL-N domain-containing protein n=2 Tax=Sphingomonas TaxID=13687 RepID=UPI000E105CBC|nr:BPL-N domain-containing protein [Sphingomonas sp.]AXJ95975.1 hypothetical protein DM480_11130 [Sphingomonas sp. FARSPH]
MKLITVLAALLAFVTASSSAFATHATDRVVRVAIYRGPAACEDCAEALQRAIGALDPRYHVDFVGPAERTDVTPATLRDYAIYIQPGGGQDIAAARRALGAARARAIRDFVAHGGRYLGLCMGAYLADRSNLGLIDADLDSEVGRPGSAATSEDDTIVPVRWGGHAATLYYQDGPFLPDAEAAGFRPIASYANGDIAAARYRRGAGVVVLSGPHPEADASWFDEAEIDRTLMPAGQPIRVLLDALQG